MEINLTEQLRRYTGQERDIAEAVLREVLPKLHQVATAALRREHLIVPLSPTELINEVWIRNLHKGNWKVNNRNHFYAIAALAMRRVLIDMARSRLAASHGSGVSALSLDAHGLAIPATEPTAESLLLIGSLMENLEKFNPEVARVVDMHYFTGFSIQEVVEITGWTDRQVRSRWRKGQNWLKDRL
ncbi:MAG: ECF-type sigma factor [Acidobacteriaceae bacterium]|nr:ECF-type sigma factor [Acidobacteriaceae bacterium]